MFRETYMSDVLPYLDYRPYPYPFGATYNEWLMVPPRVYFDSLDTPKALFRAQGGNTSTGYSYALFSYMYFVNWPSWEALVFSFDPITGTATRYNNNELSAIWLAYTSEIVQDYYGTLWRCNIFGEISPLSFYLSDGNFSITEGTPIPPSKFGVSTIAHPIVDVQNNIVAMSGGYQKMTVYNWTTGAKIRDIPLSGDARAVCAGDADYAFVLCHNGTLCTINIRTGQVLGVSQMNRVPNGTNTMLSWDYRYRRLLIFEKTPDAVDGASTSRIYGYYPVAQPTALSNPVPIIAPRINRTTPVVSRMVGDVGEALSSGVVVGELTPVAPADAALVSATETPDKNGYISYRMNGIEPGTIEFGVTAEV